MRPHIVGDFRITGIHITVCTAGIVDVCFGVGGEGGVVLIALVFYPHGEFGCARAAVNVKVFVDIPIATCCFIECSEKMWHAVCVYPL